MNDMVGILILGMAVGFIIGVGITVVYRKE
jgi:hypothetical protein